MATTKLALQQINTRLAADNQFLREQLSKLTTELNNFKDRAQRAEHSARRVILTHNRSVNMSERREAMNAARELAKHTGACVKVEG